VTFSESIPPQVKVINQSSTTGGELPMNLTEIPSINCTWTVISPGEERTFWYIVEVINSSSSMIVFNATRVSYIVDEYGSWSFSYLNELSLQVKADVTGTAQTTTPTSSLLWSPRPVFDLTLPVLFLLFAIPLSSIGFAFIILRRIRL
jgi:hypothetical protein